MADNVWDGTQWVDPMTGNTFNVDEGFWRSPQGGVYQNGQWSFGGSASGGSSTPNSSTAFNPQAGYGWDIMDRTMSHEDALQTQRLSSSERIANLQMQMEREGNANDSASRERIAQLQYQLGVEQNRLKAVEIEIDKAAEARQERELQSKLAANPNDFVQYEFYKRALGNPSTLGVVGAAGAGNPQSTSQQVYSSTAPGQYQPVAGGGAGGVPQTGGGGTGGGGNVAGPVYANQQGSIQAGQPIQGQAINPANGSPVYDSNGTPIMQNGQPYNPVASGPATGNGVGTATYSAAPPAYSDQSLQDLAASIQGGKSTLYNPFLTGKGAFGMGINAPNQLGRNAAGMLSESERAILASMVQGGINMNGRMVSIDPADYFQQMQQSWVPTLSEGAVAGNNYS